MDIEEIATRQGIFETLARYCRSLDRMDEKLFDGLWHVAATVDYEGIYQGDAAGLRKYLWATHASMAMHSHQIAGIQIECDGDHVVSEAYVTVHLWTRPDAHGQQTEVLSRGRYLDHWECRGGACRIRHRVHVADMQSFRTLESGRTDASVTRDPTDRPTNF